MWVLLLASPVLALDIYDAKYAALDQPQINAAVRKTPDGAFITYPSFDPNTFDPINSINVPVYLDTGAGGMLLSNSTATQLGINTIDDPGNPGTKIKFTDVGVGGADFFHVSEDIHLGLAPFNAATNVESPASYSQHFGPMKVQVGPISTDPPEPPFDQFDLGGFDVFGMPVINGHVMVMDARPTNNTVDILNGGAGDPSINEITMRTYLYGPAEGYHPATLDSNPGIVPTALKIKVSYGDFSGFTSTIPGALPASLLPAMAHNPFVGPNPDGTNPADLTPAVQITDGAAPVPATLLFDTGGSISMISTDIASLLGVELDESVPGSPVLKKGGVPIPGQFTITITGVGGDTTLAGWYIDDLVVPTTNGENIHYHGAPMFVHDLTLVDPDNPLNTFTLDGVLGMSYFFASTEIELLDLGGFIFPFPVNPTKGHFEWVTFDEQAGLIGVATDLNSVVVPEPASPIFLGAALAVCLVRRRRGTVTI